ncbi:MAG TPA: nicotinamide riboside transporter PnuC [Kofleriaceae bacterium]|nr:nicotinamide riboside transporter PnuC [Kofleriaceae bacterium]
MIGVAHWLDGTAVTLWGAKVSWAEAIGDASGIACVALTARQNVWNWPIGLVNNVMWVWLFFRARLYGDSTLNAFFFVLGCYGWWAWSTAGATGAPGATGAAVRVRRTRRHEWLVLAVLVALGTAGWTWFLARHTDSPVPLADASVVTLSLAATWQQAQKQFDMWWVWITVDVISVPLYVSRGLYPTALVYVVFGALCVVGLRDWRRELAAAEAEAEAGAEDVVA